MNKVKKLYSYIIQSDTGFAPNPYFGICTLACCKSSMRRNIGDKLLKELNISNIREITEKEKKHIRELGYWIIAIAGHNVEKENNVPYRSVVYVMQITDILDFESYYIMYPYKRKNFGEGMLYQKGDNLFSANYSGIEEQENLKNSNQNEKILKGKYVLLSDNFIYFGKAAYDISFSSSFNVKNVRGYQVNHREETLAELEIKLNKDWKYLFNHSSEL